MKKSLFMIMAAGLMTFAACGNKSTQNAESVEEKAEPTGTKLELATKTYEGDSLMVSCDLWYPKDAGKVIAENQKGAFIEYRGNVVPGGWCDIPGNGIAERYAKTRGFWMLSNAEIELSDGVLEQTPGFGPDDKWLFGNGDLPYPTKY